MYGKLILSLFFFGKKLMHFYQSPHLLCGRALLLQLRPLWSSHHDNVQIQIRRKNVVCPCEIERQCLVLLPNGVVRNAEYNSEFAFSFLFSAFVAET